MWLLIKAAFGGLFSSLFARWFPPKNPEVERMHAEIMVAKRGEEVFAAPDRDKRHVVDAFRLHARDADSE